MKAIPLSLDVMRERRHRRWVTGLYYLLLIILVLKVTGFFTMSENVGVTRVLKVFTRLGMTIAIIYFQRHLNRRGLMGTFVWQNSLAPLFYGFYLLMGYASLLWSTDPGYSFLQLIMDIESFVFADYFVQVVLMLRHYYPESPIRFSALLGQTVFIILLVFVIGMFTLPDQFYRLTHGGEEARLGGYFMNPNELGMLAVVGLGCFCLELMYVKSKFWVFLRMAVIFYALVATGSRSSMVGFLLIVFFFIRYSDNQKLKLAINLGAVLSIPVIIQTIFIKQGDMDEVLSMTGRLPFWQALINEGLPKEPWKGFGFMRIAYTDAFQSVHTYAGKMTHNTFMQVVMNLGFIGLTIVFFQILFTLRGIKSLKTNESQLFFIGLFIPIVINSFTEFGIFGETNYGILFWQILVFLVSIRFSPVLNKMQQARIAITSRNMFRKGLWKPQTLE